MSDTTARSAETTSKGRPRGRFRRRSRIVTAAVAAAVVIAGIVVALRGDGDDIRIVETGYSSVTEVEGGDGTSWGVIVENTTDRVAHDVQVRVECLDSSGEVIDTRVPTLNVLLPGHRIGIGSGTLTGVQGVAELRVEVVETTFREATESAEDDPEITASDLAVSYGPDNQPVVTFTATSSFSEAIDEYAVDAIFRDENGEVIGGATTMGRQPLEPNEPVTGHIVAGSPFPDLATAEVYLAR